MRHFSVFYYPMVMRVDVVAARVAEELHVGRVLSGATGRQRRTLFASKGSTQGGQRSSAQASHQQYAASAQASRQEYAEHAYRYNNWDAGRGLPWRLARQSGMCRKRG